MSQLTPRYVVNELNKYIIGQDEAKRAIAIALRNRLRRLKLDPAMQAEVKPKNILMIGPTGVGKTEIARRLAEIANAPFIKVEATKYTEIGYVGRDVEAMVRDLVEASIRMVKKIKHQEVREEAYERAMTRLAKALKPGIKQEKKQQAQPNDFMAMLQKMTQSQEEPQEVVTDDIKVSRRQIKEQLRQGLLNDKEVTIDVGVISIDTISATDISKKITAYKAIAGKTRNTRSRYTYIFAVEVEILITCPESRLAVVAIYQLITNDILRFKPRDSGIPTVILQHSHLYGYLRIIESEIFLIDGELYHLLRIVIF